MGAQARQLADLISVGPSMLRDFELLGIRSVAQLAKRDPKRMYEKLGRVARQHQDICVLDVFCAAVAQARNPAAKSREVPVVVLEQEEKEMKYGRFSLRTTNVTRRPLFAFVE